MSDTRTMVSKKMPIKRIDRSNDNFATASEFQQAFERAFFVLQEKDVHPDIKDTVMDIFTKTAKELFPTTLSMLTHPIPISNLDEAIKHNIGNTLTFTEPPTISDLLAIAETFVEFSMHFKLRKTVVSALKEVYDGLGYGLAIDGPNSTAAGMPLSATPQITIHITSKKTTNTVEGDHVIHDGTAAAQREGLGKAGG